MHHITERRFMDIKLNEVNLDTATEIIGANLDIKGFVCMNDVRNFMWATQDTELKSAINASLLSLPDGMPLVWYSRLAGARNTERIAGARIFRHLIESDNGWSHFLLGDTNERIQRIIKKAARANPNIRIDGYSPPFKPSFSREDNQVIMQKIKAANPDLIWVSFGGGRQEKWMHNHFAQLDHGIMISVGAAFRFYLGELVTPPKAVQSAGLQWIWRIVQDWPTAAARGRSKRKSITDRLVFLKHLPFEVHHARKKNGVSGHPRNKR